MLLHGSRLQHLGLRRTAVAVQVAGLGVSRGPAARLEVAQVHLAALDDAANRVSHVTRPADVVPLLADQHVIASRIHLARLPRAENVGEATSGRRLHPGRLPADAGELDERGCEIDEADVVVDDTTGLADTVPPHDRERQMIRDLVLLPLRAWKRHAVVSGDDDECVVELAAILEQREHANEVSIEVLDLEGVVEHVVAHDLVVGPEAGDRIDVGDLLAPLGGTGTVLVPAMRLVGAVPEAPWRTGGPSIEKVREVACVIVARDSASRRPRLALLERLSGELTLLAVPIPCDAGSPPLRGLADEIAVLRESLGVGPELQRKERDVVAGLLQLPGVAPGEDTCARRRALGVRRVRIVEEDALARDPVEARRLHPPTPVRAHVGIGCVVSDAEEDVGTRRLLGDKLAGPDENEHADEPRATVVGRHRKNPRDPEMERAS